MNEKVILVLISILFVSMSFSSVSAANTGSKPISHVGINVYPDYDFYIVDCVITPNQNIDYLIMVAKWYDRKGAIIGNSVPIWTLSNVQRGILLKPSGSQYFPTNLNPYKVQFFIFDKAFEGDYSKSIFNRTIYLH